MKALIVGEPTATMQPGLDTGVLIAKEMLDREFSVDYVDMGAIDWRKEGAQYFTELPIQRLVKVIPSQQEPFTLLKSRQEDVSSYDVIWQRLDPPVNERYIGHMKQFSVLPKKILQINNPNWTWPLSEHLLPQSYPEFAVTTWECDSEEKFIALVKSAKTEVVAKPLHFFSGVGIEFFNSKTSESELHEYWNRWKPRVAVQPFLKEVTSQGDLRILMMNLRVVGSVLRRPKMGSRLANLHQGASAHAFTPTAKQLRACEFISKDLYSKGLYLLGLDFIGDFLTEVNITCPSAVPQINRVMNIEAEKIMVDEMVKLISICSKG
ncbi:MAG: hypothetical protein NT000_06530 [Proteobacteria bacterium]|nr:hypothetical protein [Pseudomonadota bacterium]